MKRFCSRVRDAIEWRWRGVCLWWFGRLARLGAGVHIHSRWPWPISKPWRRRRLSLYPIEGGLGDEIMCVPILSEIKRRNSSCEVTFHCRHPELFAGNPHIDRLEKMERDDYPVGHGLIYRNAKPPPRPLMAMMAECVGLRMEREEFVRPEIAGVSDVVRETLDGVSGGFVVVQPRAGHWTPNKQWPLVKWERVIRDLATDLDVIEIGEKSIFEESPARRFHDLTGRTSLVDLMCVFSRASLFAGLPSSGMHFAAMYDVPSVIVFSGYESPAGYNYPFAEMFHEPPECAPCWLTTECPYDLKCLKGIEPSEVATAIRRRF